MMDKKAIKKDNNAIQKEKRRHPRFLTVLPLEIFLDELSIKTNTKNISSSGIFCAIDRYLPVKTRLHVNFKLLLEPDGQRMEKVVNSLAEIVRIEPSVEKQDCESYNIGITFLDMAQDERNFLLEYVHQKNLKEAKDLKKMYLRLKEMAARLVEIEECHPTAEHFRKVIERAVIDLDAAAHILDYEINELKNLE
ncbi:MAG: PilZ domain-containing protein [Candidatus Omnitrophica bacterium]|nr:PilZ domain-containing protein [Candidatus Omnitrophota bacterium]